MNNITWSISASTLCSFNVAEARGGGGGGGGGGMC